MPVMSHLPSRRKAGRGFPFHPLLVFQMALLAIFSETSQKHFFRGSCCAPFVLFGWMFLPERRAAGSGSPRRKSAVDDKKHPHRHKSLYGCFGAVQYGNCRRMSEGIGILRCPGIIYDCGVMQTPTSIFRDAEHRLLCGSVLPYEIPVFHKALSECGSLEVRPVAICVPQEIQEYCTELFGEDVQIAAASHDLFAKQVNGQIYRPLVEKYIAGEKRL